jgi:hypothetical protein
MDDEEGRGVCIVRHWTFVRRTRDGLDAPQLPLMYIQFHRERASEQCEPPGCAYPIASMPMPTPMTMPKKKIARVLYMLKSRKPTFYATIREMRFQKGKCHLNAILQNGLEHCSCLLLDSSVPVNLQSSCSSVSVG